MAGPKYKMYNQVLPWKNSIPMHFHENIYLKLIFVKCLEYIILRGKEICFPSKFMTWGHDQKLSST